MTPFYNRDIELRALEERWNAPEAQLAVLYGRRRIGKTYLLQHFLEEQRPHVYFLAAQTSLAENMRELAEALLACAPDSGLSPTDLPTFRSILEFLWQTTRERRVALVLDEFQYLLALDPSLPSQIQAWWDTRGLRSRAFLVLCGSHLGMMEGLGGAQSPLFGRFTFRNKLQPMTYDDTARFYGKSSYAAREKLMAYGVLGGTPRYHALFDPQQSLSHNICERILSPVGLLHHEPEFLISSSQVRDPAPYNAALRAIAEGCTRANEIAQRVGITPSQLSFHLKTLMDLEWVVREEPFGERSGKTTLYRISDHFIHFWYRFVAGLRSELEFQDAASVYPTRVEPFLSDYMGRHVFEDICGQYLRRSGSQRLGQAIMRSGRYWTRDAQVEMDILAELADERFLLGECKWSSSPMGMDVYYGLREKTARLPRPEYRQDPVYALFSAAGFRPDLEETARREAVLLVSGEDLLAPSASEAA